MNSLPASEVEAAEAVILAGYTDGGSTYVGAMILDEGEDSAIIYEYDVSSQSSSLVAYAEKASSDVLRLYNSVGTGLAEIDTDEIFVDLQQGSKSSLLCNLVVAFAGSFACYGFGFLPGPQALIFIIGCALLHGWISSQC